MGHITKDCIKDAWSELTVAENLIDVGQTYGAVLKCENALEELYHSASTVGEGVWFAGKENEPRTRIARLKMASVPDSESVETLVEDIRELTQETESHVIPIINKQLDYELTIDLS